ncbi:MAG: EAL domain-containing protein [Rhizobiaceae bacterium]|nr:EAL domain-containing protein [Rhizobiaceae bacterium]
MKTIIDLCNNLDCVVEGVETGVQLHIFQEIRCRMIQGYLFSRPLPSKDAFTYLRSISKRQNHVLHAPVAELTE